MSFDGAGQYSLVAGLQANLANGQPNDGTEVYAAFADIATALSTAVCKDGQTTITADLPMSSYKFTGLGAGSANGHSVRYEQLFTTGTVTLLGALTVPGAVTPQALLDISGASAGQIKFPASQNASSNANTLDDYEEGTWTPADASGAGLTFSTAEGFYTKVGRLVHWQMVVQYPVTADGSNALIDGFPFAPVGGSPGAGRAGCFITNTSSASIVQLLLMETSSGQLRLYKSGQVQATNAEASNVGIYAAGFYVV